MMLYAATLGSVCKTPDKSYPWLDEIPKDINIRNRKQYHKHQPAVEDLHTDARKDNSI